jgi:glycosyltransferase involved in cell wall biosynthesis
MTKVILISQSPLPAYKIGSWTTLYKNYLESNHKVDVIICEKPKVKFETVEYLHTNNTILNKIESRIRKKSYLSSLKALNRLVDKETKYIIQVVDNFKIISDIENLLIKKGIRSNCYIQFFYHGFAPFLENPKSINFFKVVDEMILLTNDSYKAHKSFYNVLPSRISILHNGINENNFYKVSGLEKNKLKDKLNITGKTVFIWCSQDSPKKGLHLILDAWKRVYAINKEIVLLVVGSKRSENIEGVSFVGRVPNKELPEYYQAAEVYLFPSLCQEGFGLSLIEALHCGCYCIASSLGGISEVLEYGKFGMLINRPHIITDWEAAINWYLKNKPIENNFPKELYTTVNWNKGMDKIIEDAKLNLAKL